MTEYIGTGFFLNLYWSVSLTLLSGGVGGGGDRGLRYPQASQLIRLPGQQ